MKALAGGGLEAVFRDRYVPVDRHLAEPGCIVTDQASHAAAIAAGRRIVGWTRQADLLNAIHNVHSALLVEEAGNRLAAAMPQFSAKRQMTVPQVCAGLLLFVGVMTAILIDARITVSIIAVLSCCLFLSVAAVRAASLMHASDTQARAAAGLRNDQLPVYTVLVALFREMEVVDQLVTALQSLDYPALGSKRTKYPIPNPA